MIRLSRINILKEKISQLMESKDMCDITLIVGPEKTPFTTHKFLLSIFSDVFHSMFYGPMAEKSAEIQLPEDSVEAVKIFLSCIYTDSLKVETVEEIISGLYFADKYMVLYMKDVCSACLERNIYLKSVLKIYEAARTLQETELESKCWIYIINNASKIMKEDSFKYASFEIILRISAEDNLLLESEVDLYNAVVKWGKHHFPHQNPESLREKLKPLFRQVRFLTMNPSEFVGNPCEDGILTKDEQLNILKEICGLKKFEDDIIGEKWRKPRKSASGRSLKEQQKRGILMNIPSHLKHENRIQNYDKWNNVNVKDSSRNRKVVTYNGVIISEYETI